MIVIMIAFFDVFVLTPAWYFAQGRSRQCSHKSDTAQLKFNQSGTEKMCSTLFFSNTDLVIFMN